MARWQNLILILVAVLAFWILAILFQSSNATLTKATAEKIKRDWGKDVADASQFYNIPASRILAVIGTESKGNELAIGGAGERGLGQFMPGTWTEITGLPFADAYEGRTNIFAIAKYLDKLSKVWGDLDTATQRYNGSDELKTLAYLERVKANERFF